MVVIDLDFVQNLANEDTLFELENIYFDMIFIRVSKQVVAQANNISQSDFENLFVFNQRSNFELRKNLFSILKINFILTIVAYHWAMIDYFWYLKMVFYLEFFMWFPIVFDLTVKGCLGKYYLTFVFIMF